MLIKRIVLTSLFFLTAVASSTPIDEATAAYRRQDYAAASKIASPLAKSGDRSAKVLMGLMLIKQKASVDSVDEGTLLIIVAAEEGYPEAQMFIGNIFFQDGMYKEAEPWFNKAAMQGNALAQLALGTIFETGGESITKDYKEAVKWYKLAAEQGNAFAQNRLGNIYATGEGVSRDYKEASKWIKLAADQGDSEGQANLAKLYFDGTGLPQDYAEAFKLFQKSAAQGNVKAQRELIRIYTQGKGTKVDIVRGFMWLNIVAADGSKENAKFRDGFAKLLTPEQLEEAQKMSRECQNKDFKGC